MLQNAQENAQGQPFGALVSSFFVVGSMYVVGTLDIIVFDENLVLGFQCCFSYF